MYSSILKWRFFLASQLDNSLSYKIKAELKQTAYTMILMME